LFYLNERYSVSFRTEYISRSFSLFGNTNKNLYSLYCYTYLTTGPPCPNITDIPTLLYAPYVYSVLIEIDSTIFEDVRASDNINLIIGESFNCGMFTINSENMN
jgi:hypothetical protein